VAARRVKEMGQTNDLIERLRHEPMLTGLDLDHLLDPAAFIGRAPEQVDDFLHDCVKSVREGYASRYSVLSSSEPNV
jgi:adenylosuccinate lyase